MNSAFLLCYASAGVVSGHISDKFSQKKRLFIFIVHLLIGVNVIFLGALQYFDTAEVALFFVIRIIDGTIQSVGWAVNLAVMSNWFPKRGRGLLIGCWASNANTGDIIGAQIYRAATDISQKNVMWGNGIMIVGGLVIFMGIVNMLFLIEFPEEKGISIDENSHILEFKGNTVKPSQIHKKSP
jgi:sugar phosphate permease